MNPAVYKIMNSMGSSAVAERVSTSLPERARLDDIQLRVASAIDIPPKLVIIDGHRSGFSGWVLQSWGTAAGTRFFSKTFLVDPYPIIPRFATPGEELAGPETPQRPVAEQVEFEWNMVHEMRSVVGSRNIPGLLGRSLDYRTIVFEEVSGLRIDRPVNVRWRGRKQRRSLETAIFHAGAWLRTLHDLSLQGHETLNFSEIAASLNGVLCKRAVGMTPYAEHALRAIDCARQVFNGRPSLRIPVALNHGDFTLPNLLWDDVHQHLWVVDLELSARRPILHDLCTMLCDLRRRLLHPLTSPRAIKSCEMAFWRGYGRIPEDLVVLASAMATARIFYASLPRIRTLRERRGWRGGLKASIYKTFCEPFMVRRILRAG